MKKINGILLYIVTLLVLADLSWRVLDWSDDANGRTSGLHVNVIGIHTNDADGVEIVESKTGKPLWIEWQDKADKTPEEFSYFFQGTKVLNVYLRKSQPPLYRFIFHGPGKSEQWWLNLGGEPTFTGRVSYDTNGDLSDFDVWLNESWHAVERRNGHNGVIINGEWQQLSADTNGFFMKQSK